MVKVYVKESMKLSAEGPRVKALEQLRGMDFHAEGL